MTKLSWFYISYATETTFLGAAVVQASDPIGAGLRAHELGIDPGGQAVAIEIGAEPRFPVEMRDVLLTKAQLSAYDEAQGDGPIRSLGEIANDSSDSCTRVARAMLGQEWLADGFEVLSVDDKELN